MSIIRNLIRICEEISKDLILRDQTGVFFDELDNKSEESIIIDFSGICSISRSFAAEYFLRKAKSHKQIIECNLPENVQKMFQVITGLNRKSRLSELDSLSFIKIESTGNSNRTA